MIKQKYSFCKNLQKDGVNLQSSVWAVGNQPLSTKRSGTSHDVQPILSRNNHVARQNPDMFVLKLFALIKCSWWVELWWAICRPGMINIYIYIMIYYLSKCLFIMIFCSHKFCAMMSHFPPASFNVYSSWSSNITNKTLYRVGMAQY